MIGLLVKLPVFTGAFSLLLCVASFLSGRVCNCVNTMEYVYDANSGKKLRCSVCMYRGILNGL